MKKRYFHALLLLLLAMMLPSKMWADKSIYTVYCEDGTDKIIYFVYQETEPSGTWDDKTITAVYASADGWRNSYKTDVTKVVFDESFADARPTSTGQWFSGCEELTTIEDISNLNTSSVDDMYDMFRDCSSLTSLDLSNFNTASVEDMSNMFDGCSALTSLNVSSFNTSSVTSMASMFYGCFALTSLNVSSFNTASVTDMNCMFGECSALTSLDLSSFNTSSVDDMNFMFSGCSALEHIYMDILNPWDTNLVTSSDYMFKGCTKLPDFDSSNVTKEYIDNYITKAFTYSDNVDMSSNLGQLKTKLGVSDLKDGTIPALILDRTMPTTNYGTICLPVALSTKAEVENVFGTGTVVKKLKNATFDSSNNILSFTFEEKDNIEAGKPYLIKSTLATPQPIEDTSISATADGSITIEDVCTMYGLLTPQAMTEDRSILFMSGGELYYPNGGTLKAMRCYFQLEGDAEKAAKGEGGASSARPRAVINFDNDPSETGILSINADGSLTYEETGDWYTLGGVKLSGKPTTKGMYILNGKKYIVK